MRRSEENREAKTDSVEVSHSSIGPYPGCLLAYAFRLPVAVASRLGMVVQAAKPPTTAPVSMIGLAPTGLSVLSSATLTPLRLTVLHVLRAGLYTLSV